MLKLIIADRYAEDSGVLKRWSLIGMISAEISSEPQRTQRALSSIPDNDPEGVSAPLEVEAEGTLKAITAWSRSIILTVAI